ncbi:carbohydrate ABC transporter permease [Clostridium omnivorum]|uniref:ABC transporter permease n=1 Tax=Clostridium omnivorum TaxID=1604902 RepID=A0ABQ5N6S1_9CLOT|nr:carbohydrate ABC transporter permease [Clostridium sp. E14]GLC30892.1 ABC transporter permease [Clostridium sp. E14]
MLIKRSKGEKVFNVFNIIFMIAMMIVTVYPLLHVVFASVSDSNELLAHRGLLLKPIGFNFAAYKMVFKNPMIVRGYINTLIVVVFGVALNILMTSLAAYVLSRKDFLWKSTLMFFVVFTMFFSGGLIPFYFTVKSLHIDDSYLALILPVAINTFNLIIMRTSFEAIPDSLEESAKLDGANHFTILFKIILPLSLPIVAVMVLYYAVFHWNAWFNAMIFINDRSLYPLQLVLREILIQNDTSVMAAGIGAGDQEAIGESIKYAVIVVATLPILCVYPFLQKYFVKGALVGAVKG